MVYCCTKSKEISQCSPFNLIFARIPGFFLCADVRLQSKDRFSAQIMQGTCFWRENITDRSPLLILIQS